MKLREQIAEIIGGELYCQDKIYPIIKEDRTPKYELIQAHIYHITQQILSLPLPNWIVEEKCHHLQHMGDTAASPMEHSKFCECCGTGIITRPALLSDLEREDVKLRRKE